jgi:uncharacterized protein YwgA
MFLQVDFKYANEVLYTLDSADRITKEPISKLGLQKILYLSACFAPIKNVVLAAIKYVRHNRGPYSKEIQNTVDQLVAYDLAEITDFTAVTKKISYASYRITEGGKSAVAKLRQYSAEEEKAWWINCVVKLSKIYINEDYLSEDEQFDGLEKIVRLVYRDDSFKAVEHKRWHLIDFESSPITHQVIAFTTSYLDKDKSFHNLPEKTLAELVLLAFFEQLLSNYVESKEQEVVNEY